MKQQQQQELIPIDEECQKIQEYFDGTATSVGIHSYHEGCQKIQEYFDGTATAVGIHSYRRGMSKDSGIF